ncbi:hypothetical protein D3C80_1911390 [compost metagenome]
MEVGEAYKHFSQYFLLHQSIHTQQCYSPITEGHFSYDDIKAFLIADLILQAAQHHVEISWNPIIFDILRGFFPFTTLMLPMNSRFLRTSRFLALLLSS